MNFTPQEMMAIGREKMPRLQTPGCHCERPTVHRMMMGMAYETCARAPESAFVRVCVCLCACMRTGCAEGSGTW